LEPKALHPAFGSFSIIVNIENSAFCDKILQAIVFPVCARNNRVILKLSSRASLIQKGPLPFGSGPLRV